MKINQAKRRRARAIALHKTPQRRRAAPTSNWHICGSGGNMAKIIAAARETEKRAKRRRRRKIGGGGITGAIASAINNRLQKRESGEA